MTLVIVRRGLIAALGVAAAWSLAALAQQPERMRRIGVLMLYPENDPEGQVACHGVPGRTTETRLGRRPQCSDRFSMGLRQRRLDTIRRAIEGSYRSSPL